MATMAALRDLAFMAPGAYSLRYDGERHPQIVFSDAKDRQNSGAEKGRVFARQANEPRASLRA